MYMAGVVTLWIHATCTWQVSVDTCTWQVSVGCQVIDVYTKPQLNPSYHLPTVEVPNMREATILSYVPCATKIGETRLP